MEKYKKLFNNSIIFIIGNFGSKLINLIMVPLYTQALSLEEYGNVDLVTTTINLLIPIITLEFGQSVIRFVIESNTKEKKQNIFNLIIIVSIVITVIALLLLPIVNYFNLFGNNYKYFIILLLLNSYSGILAQFARGIGKIRAFAFNGILVTIITVSLNILFLVVLNYGLDGYFISLIIANFISVLYLFMICGGLVHIRKFTFRVKDISKMFSYSIPLIPNSVIWWIINGSTRYFILYFVGTAGNGLFAVANKIPSIISIFTSIFSQAWQISSFEEYRQDSKDTSSFYSKVYSLYFVGLMTVGSSILLILKPLMSFLVSESFYIGWQIVPGLVLAVIYQSLSGFIGTIYTASKNTKGVFSTSIYGGLLSAIFNMIFIPFLGVNGAGIGMALSFLLMFVIRFIDTRKFVKIQLNLSNFIISNLIYVGQSISIFLWDGLLLIFINIIFLSCILLINRQVILALAKTIFKR
ncbi:lipopolysaccharide biosynthesis protein [Aerococcus urinaeequi]|uniref:Polysaccharide biosynthesis protein C-terminal domain-containing protein n=1 Tax=Aerococcus urinaeequi TaxID=51665 RepID=A0AAC8WZQ7_9LACT|nr:oligosaccharide flippase family protein [Aerococcus urinaeequi]AMB97017.1 hypothetical protein AWM74_01665 [Aerococcus urinaeequi]